MSSKYHTEQDLTRVKEKRPIRSTLIKLYELTLSFASFIVIVLVLIDSIVNNWAINDMTGKAHFLKTPIATSSSAGDLEAQFTFPKGQSISDMSKIGIFMLNYTIDAVINRDCSEVYLVYTGTYPLTTETEICHLFKATYDADLAKSPIVRLGVASNSLMYVRGDAISHIFSDDMTAKLANSSMTAAQLKNLGYTPARTNVDIRLTSNVHLVNTTAPQTQQVSFYRVFPKTFCTGCAVVTELGFAQCNMTFVYNDTAKQVKITQSSNDLGTMVKVALMFQQSKFSSASLYLKFLAILFAIGGYAASRRTIQWKEVDMTKAETLVSRIVQTVSPKYFPYASLALRFDMFCYNSDLFVFFYAAAVILDMQYGLYYSKTINLWNDPRPQFLNSVLMFCISLRFLWINCAAIKIMKLVWSTISTASYNGESKIMGFFNLSSVLSLYLSSILLFYIPAYMAYNNGVTFSLDNRVDNLDPVTVDPFESYYIRSVPHILVGIILNIFIVLLLDQIIYYKRWCLLKNNSLGRQAIFNSSSILCDYLHGIEVDMEGDNNGAIIYCKARRLSTLQWFFMNHLFLFGLPQKELRARKKALQGTNTQKTSTTTHDQQGQVSNGKYFVVQNGDSNHIQLIDENLTEMTALVYNIKVLKDLPIAIQ